jgi:hypothetical protein
VATGVTVWVTGSTVLATVVATGVTVLVTGASVFAVVVATGAVAAATGAWVLAVGFATGVTALVTGALAVVVVVTTGVAVLVTGAVAVAATEAVVPEAVVPVVFAPVVFAPMPGAPVAEGLAEGPEEPPVTDEPAELRAEVAEVTVDETKPATGEAVVGAAEDVDVSGGRAAVSACAGRENNTRIAKIPAAASAACIAPRATRRTIGCMSSSHST